MESVHNVLPATTAEAADALRTSPPVTGAAAGGTAPGRRSPPAETRSVAASDAESSLSAFARWWYRPSRRRRSGRDDEQLVVELQELSAAADVSDDASGAHSGELGGMASHSHSPHSDGGSGRALGGRDRRTARQHPSYGDIVQSTDGVLLSDELLHALVKPDMAGYLFYRWRMRWQRCWFSLDGSQLRFFERNAHSGQRGHLIHTISLFCWGHVRTPSFSDPRRPHLLELRDGKGSVHYFSADTEEDIIRWKEAFFRARSIAPPAHAIPSLAERPSAADAAANTAVVGATYRHSIHGANAEVTPPKHLICIVHGIGSDEERLRKNLKNFHDALDDVMQRTLPDVISHFRFKTIYCHWRAALKRLQVYRRMTQLNPLGDRSPSRMRTLINTKLMDILFYLTPRIRRFIQCEVVRQLNDEYARFVQRYPEFEGEVSLIGHSLGSVISYELLVKQVLSDPALLEQEGLRLHFRVSTLFLTGSPLGHVLNVDDELHATIGRWPFRLVNIINPSDPAACRIEPLVDPAFADVPPVEMPPMSGGKSSWLSFSAGGRQNQEPTATTPRSGEGSGPTVGADADARAPLSASARHGNASEASMTSAAVRREPNDDDDDDDAHEAFWVRDTTTAHLQAVRQRLRHARIDYVMRTSFMDDIIGLTAHLNYWHSRDVAYFIIHFIIRRYVVRVLHTMRRQQAETVPRPPSPIATTSLPRNEEAMADEEEEEALGTESDTAVHASNRARRLANRLSRSYPLTRTTFMTKLSASRVRSAAELGSAEGDHLDGQHREPERLSRAFVSGADAMLTDA
ncbi:hypothetical protein CDCA_CDCA07G2039 [Cyanidium caldarium]|uniref:Uncharacterized protein n=1 Tax=Cyanidium caldarium TaxID=2771 RepID=A0AAV9IV46_CYACA|nr:hypothetical protein CDCA_CDCA07G2039 [Cyanidium caldarium]|eukprot:ctg_824.g279